MGGKYEDIEERGWQQALFKMSRCLDLIVKFKLSRCFSELIFNMSNCISVSIMYFFTFSSWKKHYFGNFRNSLSALRNGIEDSVMSQF